MCEVLAGAKLLDTHDAVVGEEDAFFERVVDIAQQMIPDVAQERANEAERRLLFANLSHTPPQLRDV